MPHTSRHPLSKIALAGAISLAIHSTLYAASDIQSGTAGTGQNASASVTSSDPANTITATGGSGAPNSNGGNATASATLTPTADSNSTLTATGGTSGTSGTNTLSTLPTIGGNATTSASINASANVTLTLTATGGAGDSPVGNAPPYGDGGNATASASVFTSGNISINVTSLGGAGGGSNTTPPNEGTGGTASIGSISAISTSGDITLVANDLGGNGNNNNFFISSPNGIGADASVVDALSASTSGNITLTQNAGGGFGRIVGNANSSLTFTCLTAASINASVNASTNPFLTLSDLSAASQGSANAYANITGSANVVATAEAGAGSLNASAGATAIVHAGPILGFAPGVTYAKAMAIAASSFGPSPVSAAAYVSDRYFSNAEVFANSNVSGPGVCAGFFTTNPPPGISSIQAGFPLLDPVSSTNDPNTRALVSATTTLDEAQISPQTTPLEVFAVGFEGTLDTSSLPDEDLIIALMPGFDHFHTFQLIISVDHNIELSNSYTNLTLPPATTTTYYDLGPLKNFGDDPIDIKVEMDVTFLDSNEFVRNSTFKIYDMNPALLTAATLPLLLKRRRNS